MGNEKLTTLARRLRPFFSKQVADITIGGSLVTEGPDIDLVTTLTGIQVGRGGDTVLLFDSGGSPLAEYAATSAGLIAAVAAAAAGDTVEVPSITITLGATLTIPAGITLSGISALGSIIIGTIVNNGNFQNISVTGNITNTGVMRYITQTVNSGIGITNSALGNIAYCTIGTYSTATHGIYITGGRVSFTAVGGDGIGIGIYANEVGGEIYIGNSRFFGRPGGQIEICTSVHNCFFFGSVNYDGLLHTAGTAYISDTRCSSVGGSGYGLKLTAPMVHLSNVGWGTISATGAMITYIWGDRGAYSVEDYHANDIESVAPTRHNPLPGAAGGIPYSDGTNWTRVALTSYLGVRATITITTGTTALAATHDVVLCNAVGGAIIVNLPAAATNTGRAYTIKKIDASANTVTINGSGAETIDGVTPQVISFQWTSITIVCDGTGWYII